MPHNDSLWFMTTIHLTPQQESLTRALVACGYYGNQSEVGRAAFDNFFRELPSARKREIALYLYKHSEATVSRFAEIADMPLSEARALLQEEKPLDERARCARSGTTRARKKSCPEIPLNARF